MMKSAAIALTVAALGLAFDGISIVAEQQPPAGATAPPAGQPPAGPGGGRGQGRGGGGGRGIAVLPFEDRTGFESMFNGTSLDPGEQQIIANRKAQAEAQAKLPPEERGRGGRGGGGMPPVSRFQDWNGDPKFWRAENGMIIGESTPEKVVGPNTFLIWRGGTPGDFELKVEIRMNSTNSGIQYRSKMLQPNEGGGDNPGHAWRLGGYQMDMDFANSYPGILYEEAGRGFLAERGKITYIAPDGTKSTIGQVESAEQLAATFKPGDWNQFHLIARGNTLVHIVNGHVTAVCIDDDLKNRSLGGLIGFQLHAGPPMKLELRNLAIKLR
jgi:3-keto-disaccharide hydrolase